MKPFKDYYFTLGLTKTASQSDIDRAYEYSVNVVRTNSRGDAAMTEAQGRILADIEEAYACLGNPARRNSYDKSFDEFVPRHIQQRVPDGGYTPRNNAREAVEHAFIAMKRKKSRSLSLSSLFSTVALLLCVGVVSAGGYYHLRHGVGFFTGPVARALQTGNTEPPISSPAATNPPEPAGERKVRPYVTTFEIRYGAVITADRAACRKEPAEGSPAANTVTKNAVAFATKEARSEDGSIWYYIENGVGTALGWVNGMDVKIYR